ncbi:MAG TPA: hypothetical protein VEK06_01110 [Myxococcota bacterium]|nr:hypothetical protein [Myxococcota bacterium]
MVHRVLISKHCQIVNAQGSILKKLIALLGLCVIMVSMVLG